MRANLAAPPPAITQGYVTQLLRQLTQLFARVVPIDQAVPLVILQSPDGTAWDVTVDNSGALLVTPNPGATKPGGHPP